MSEYVGGYSFDDYLRLISNFHSYPAPGLIVGGYMVEMAKRHMPPKVLFDAISEAASCLPDAIQLLTPCTVGNGWLKIVNLDRYALSLFDKYTGEGVRVFLDPAKLEAFPQIRDWYLKRKTKKEQDSDALRAEMRAAGEAVLTLTPVQVASKYVGKSSKGPISICPLCHEAYPKAHGGICKGCQGQDPYEAVAVESRPPLRAVAVEQAVGQAVLHDMTRIVPGRSKGAEFTAGQVLSVGDVCRLQHMGKNRIYVQDDEAAALGAEGWVHEDTVAERLTRSLCREGSVVSAGAPREGKAQLLAGRDGLLAVDVATLERFNLLGQVVCATRHHGSLVRAGQPVAATRAVPLYLPGATLAKALALLDMNPMLRVLPLRKARVGLLITGSEVFTGLIEDRFEPTMRAKVEALGSEVLGTALVPDDRQAIADAAARLLDAGADLLVTTAGLSVDPDDVTRQALLDAGLRDEVFGLPVAPGNMALVGRMLHQGREVQVLGVPACALFHATTSIDVLLPRLLAGLPLERRDLAGLGHGGLCLECPSCVYPHCPFGK